MLTTSASLTAWLASLSYAAGCKRAGRYRLASLFMVLGADGETVYVGAWPSAHRRADDFT